MIHRQASRVKCRPHPCAHAAICTLRENTDFSVHGFNSSITAITSHTSLVALLLLGALIHVLSLSLGCLKCNLLLARRVGSLSNIVASILHHK